MILCKLEECKEYLLNLRLENRQLLIHSKRKTGFLGFLINIESLKMLYQDICQKEQTVPYIPLYQISQDHLEIFFGCIRAFGRQNNNPTVTQFKAAFKRLLIKAEIKGATTGNCIALDYIPILSATSAFKPDEVINRTSTIMRMIDDYEINNENYANNFAFDHDHPYIIALSHTIYLTEYATEVVTYIAGFIVRRLNKSIMCELCTNALISNSKIGIIQIKDRGSLIYPSPSVIKICLETEKIIKFTMKEKPDVILNSKYTLHNITQNF